MHAIGNEAQNTGQGALTLRRRSFFGRLLLVAAGTSFLPRAARALFGRSKKQESPLPEASVRVRINELAVPRTLKGPTRNG